METIEKIIAEAKTKECWTVGHRFNYGPIEHIKENVLYKDGKVNFDEYEKCIHLVTDWRTFLAYEYSKFDIHIDVTELICTIQRTFPEMKQNQRAVLLQIGKFAAEDNNKDLYLNYAVLNDSVKSLGMNTYELLGIYSS